MLLVKQRWSVDKQEAIKVLIAAVCVSAFQCKPEIARIPF